MSEPKDLQRIKEILQNPSEEGVKELVQFLKAKPSIVRVEAAKAILDLGYGPPGGEGNEEEKQPS